MNDFDKLLIVIALAIVVLASLIEAVVLARTERYDWTALGVSLFDMVGRHVVRLVLPLSVATPVLRFASAHQLTTIALDSWKAFALLFIGQEFCYYWYHRASHRVRWFWANHAVHHSPNQLNLAAAYRTGVLDHFSGSLIFFVPLVWVGFSPGVVVATLVLNLIYQFWIHATWIPKLGWLEYVLNTPSAHRVHHAANVEYLDANFGGVLILFDRLFGTYVEERDDVPCRYGLVHPQISYNPLRVEFDQWLSLLKDLLHARTLRALLGHLVMPPGWRPDEPGETVAELRERALGRGADGIARPLMLSSSQKSQRSSVETNCHD